MTIDKDKLRQLASDPKNKAKDIRDGLGFKNDAALHYALNKDAEAKKIYSERASATKSGKKVPARRPRRTATRAQKTAAPPATVMPRAMGRVSDELLRKVRLEMEFIATYDEKTEHFDEVLGELKAAIK